MTSSHIKIKKNAVKKHKKGHLVFFMTNIVKEGDQNRVESGKRRWNLQQRLVRLNRSLPIIITTVRPGLNGPVSRG